MSAMELEKGHDGDLLAGKLDELLHREKQCRQNSDVNGSTKVVMEIVNILWDTKDLKRFREYLLGLSKKRGQAKKAITEMVQFAMKKIDDITNESDRLAYIETLKEVCDKKIYLEVEYARCALMLVKTKQSAAEKREAVKILEDVQVETYGSMAKREKLEFILQLMRMQLELEEYVKFLISSRKVSRKVLEDEDLVDLKLVYYSYMVRYYIHEGQHMETAEAYKAIFETLHKNRDAKKNLEGELDFGFIVSIQNSLENYVMFLLLNQHSLERHNHLHSLQTNHFITLEQFPHLDNVVKSFLSKELISTDINKYNVKDLQLFSNRVENGKKHEVAFVKQLIQHNVQIIEKYYSRISFRRFSELLQVSADEVETELCDMINAKLVYAKIDRVSGIVDFRKKRTDHEILDEWNTDISKLLDLVDQTCNLIKRDNDPTAQKN